MAKIAFISDIHGNYLALETVFKDMEKRGVDKIYCLGDIAFKYGEPGKVVDALRSNAINIRGNVDEYLIDRFKNGQSPSALKDIMENDRSYSFDNVNWMASLPFFMDLQMGGHMIRLVHASPLGIERIYNPSFDNTINPRYNNNARNGIILDSEEFFEAPEEGFTLNKPDIVIYGHTHIPNYEETNSGLIINPGSVGDPVFLDTRDGKKIDTPAPEISYVIIEGSEQLLNGAYSNKEKLKIDFIRLPYLDILKQMRDNYASGTYPVLQSNIDRVNTFANILMNNPSEKHGEVENHEYEGNRRL